MVCIRACRGLLDVPIARWRDCAIKLALLCTHVWLELEVNGHRATLRREVAESSQTSMDVFGGAYEDALQAPVESWTRYPYKRSSQKESFSQALFRLLGMPDVASEGSGNITMHQLLRLLYSDQLSPIENLFRQDTSPFGLRLRSGFSGDC